MSGPHQIFLLIIQNALISLSSPASAGLLCNMAADPDVTRDYLRQVLPFYPVRICGHTRCQITLCLVPSAQSFI